jgi:proteasome accessory factor C
VSDTAATRFRRLLALLPRLTAGEQLSLEALARESGVPVPVILADLEALCHRFDDRPGHDDIGILIEGDRVTVRTDHFRRPMRLTAAEICALELGLSVLGRERPQEEGAAVLALRDRLTQLITRLPQDAQYHGLRDGALADRTHADALPILRRALREQRAVEIAYQRAQDGGASTRTVRPYRLVFHHGSWYLIGWCESSEGVRMFRVDRIASAALTGGPHDIPADFRMDDLMHDGRPFIAAGPPQRLAVRFSPAIARWIAERDGQPLEADGSALRTFPLADREWAVRHLLQYGPDVQVIAPEEIREEIVDRLRALSR